MPMFQKSVINKYLSNIDQNLIETAYQTFKGNYTSAKIEKIKRMKEEEYQDGFLRDLFVSSLGYALKPDDNFNLVREFKNLTDGGKADGAILKDGMAIAVIELKSAKTKELKSITEQAFNYKNNQPECKYVITSNFHKLRFYIDYSNEFVEFNLFDLSKKKFEVLYLVLSKESVFAGTPIKLKKESVYQEENISKQFYKDYSDFKNKLFENLIKNNPEHDKLTLFKKSQKLIDRFLFILFAEDRGLLQPNLINRIIQRYKILEEQDFKQPLYNIFKQFFGYLNTGCKGKRSTDDIPAYNGGLFCPDETLDRIIIDDATLLTDLPKLSSYDFNTELDVDILGHIFEHSLSEIEEITAELKGVPANKAKSKRKKDGVFYTPKYITQYIVENTIGRLCTEKRDESELADIEIDDTCYLKSGKLSEKGKQLYSKIEDYKSWLLSLKIVDPACGSGAFLNQALNFLIDEHRFIIELETELKKGQISLFNIEAAVLENNLYGVDINEESVEIAKLSLWLRTARKGRKLTDLSNNIKCGNSLIDDPEIAGDKAFNWQNEFPDIFAKGGFDVVIGNPPYLGGQFLKRKETEYNFILNNYNVAEYQFDLYILFYELSLKICKINGFCSFISPNTWFTNISNKPLRKYILDNSTIRIIVDYSTSNVFKDAVVMTAIVVLQKCTDSNSIINIYNPENYYKPKFQITQNSWLQDENHVFNLSLSEKDIALKQKIKNSTKRLDKLANVKFGVKIYEVGKGKPPQTKEQAKAKIYETTEKLDVSYLPYLEGKDINSFLVNWSNKWLKYGKNLAAPRKIELFKGKRILVRRIMGKRLICAYLNEDIITNALLQIVKPYAQEYTKSILLILSSSTIAYFFRKSSYRQDIVFPEIKIHELSSLPIKIPTNINDFNLIANKMISLNNKLQTEKNNFLNTLKEEKGIEKISKKLNAFYDLEYAEFKKELRKKKIKIQLGNENNEWRAYFNTAKQKIKEIQSLINNTDREIDLMVYKLYDLTDEEIKIVESET
ncbi:N-6 DNA methylase [Desulfococcaceae bacterium HSG7]|nr:N-6 DNA methylase [Desulfococcaceae bacterium HSG7]